MNDMTPEKATALRKPFPPESIGKLPKGGTMLDYVGHAAVTDRLLTVDPAWAWEPMALDQFGSPQCDREGNLWIKLTVCGVTRLGVGDGKSMKERIGDAIRNAAMRFGVALDLWAKEDLVEFAKAAQAHQSAPAAATAPAAAESPLLKTSGALAKRMFALMGEAGITDRELRLAFVSETVGRTVASSAEMTDDDARAVTKRLEAMLDNPFPADQDGGAA